MVAAITDGEETVRDVFMIKFPNDDYSEWDTEIEDSVADDMIEAVGKASKIDVQKFIEDLWQSRATGDTDR